MLVEYMVVHVDVCVFMYKLLLFMSLTIQIMCVSGEQEFPVSGVRKIRERRQL